MKTIQITLSALFIFMMSPTISAQIDTSAQNVSTTHSVLHFQYSEFNRMYTLKTDLVYSNLKEMEDLLVYLSYDHGKKIALIPHHEDFKPLTLDGTLISYCINAEDKLEVHLRNPSGGTPWSTLSFTNFSITTVLLKGDFVPGYDAIVKE